MSPPASVRPQYPHFPFFFDVPVLAAAAEIERLRFLFVPQSGIYGNFIIHNDFVI